MTTYNINELLDEKKSLEQSMSERNSFPSTELLFEEIKTIDFTNNKNSSSFVPRERVTLKDFCQEFFGMTDRMKSVKVAIQDYNATQILDKIQERDSVRRKIQFLRTVKINLTHEKTNVRKPTRQSGEGQTIEVQEITREPMFDIKDVELMIDEFASQERKVNTEIQKMNLNAKIEI